MSGTGKDDETRRDYWKIGDPNLRSKVIASVGVVAIGLSFVLGVAINLDSFEEADTGVMFKQRPGDADKPPTSVPAISLAGFLFITFIAGVILVITGIILYFRKRKKRSS